MKTSAYCYFNGDLVRYGDCSLHISDMLLQRGYGVFDFFRTMNGEILWLEDYTDRLFRSMELSEIEHGLTKLQFTGIISTLQEKNRIENGAFKVIVTGGYSDTLESVTGPPNFIVLNRPWTKPPKETFEKGVNLVSYEYVRPNAEIKTLNYFNTMRLRRKFKEYDSVDVLFHTHRISEASRANIFCVKNGRISTPKKDILHGVKRKVVLSLFPEIQIEDIPAEGLYSFDEMFITSTSRDISPVVNVEGKKIGNGKPGPFTRTVQSAFRERGWM